MNKSIVRIFSIICYVLLLIINGFMFYFLGTYFNLIFLSALIVVPIVSYVNGLLASHFVDVTISGASFVENRNDEFVFTINASNNSVFFSNTCVIQIDISNSLQKDTYTHSLTMPLTPMGTVSTTYPVKSDHCGIIKISVPSVWVYDLLTVFSFKKNINFTKEIPVFPNYNVIDEEFEMDYTEGYSEISESTAKGNDSSEVTDVREYIPGDKLQDIHWKLSAKKDILMVKEHISLASEQLVLYIELAETQDSLIDIILDYAYGIGISLCQNNVSFTYIWYSLHSNECKKRLIQNQQTLHDTILEMLYEAPIKDYLGIRDKIKAMSGHENFITIGTEYVLENKKEA